MLAVFTNHLVHYSNRVFSTLALSRARGRKSRYSTYHTAEWKKLSLIGKEWRFSEENCRGTVYPQSAWMWPLTYRTCVHVYVDSLTHHVQ